MSDPETGWLLQALVLHGLPLLALLCLIEGPLATLAAAWLAANGILPLGAVIAIALAGEILGDALHYGAGRAVLPRLSLRWRDRLGLSAPRIAALGAEFQARGAIFLLVGKFTHAAGALVLVTAGAVGMHFGRFMLWTSLAGLPKVLLLIALGWSLGLAQGLAGSVWAGLTLGVTVLALGWLGWRLVTARRRGLPGAAP